MVHVVWDQFLEQLPQGAHPWRHISANAAREALRHSLRLLSVPEAEAYGTHDFRRGHAEDMRKSGCTLAQILNAGQWKSTAFLAYINEAELEKDTAFQVAVDSDVEDWID